jgi:Fic family protein
MKKLSSLWLNERQIRLINYFLENLNSYTNVTTHQNYNKIARWTATFDLKDLEKKWLLISIKSWKVVNYFPIDDLEEKIR